MSFNEQIGENTPVVTPDTGTKRPRSAAIGWRIFLLSWALFLLIAGAVGCGILYRYLAAFEASRPEPVIDSLMAETPEEIWIDYALRGLEEGISRYDDGEALKAAYRESFLAGRDPVCIKDMTATTDTELVYTVRMSSAPCCSIRLCRDTSRALGFGLSPWQVSEIVPCSGIDALSATAVEITVPKGETVYLNGNLLDDSAVVDSNVPVETVSRFEQGLGDLPCLVRFRVEGLRGGITVTNGAGEILDPVSSENGLISYYVGIRPEYSVSIRVPNSAQVLVNGVAPGEAEITGVSQDLLKGLEAYTGGAAYYTVTYQIGGLYRAPQVQVSTADGIALEPAADENGTLCYTLPQDNDLREERLSRVQGFFRRYMNCTTSAFDIDNYHELLYYILPDTNLFTYVKDSNIAMLWNSDTDVTYRELDFYGFRAVSDSCFVCRIFYSADISAAGWGENFSYQAENRYDLVWVKSSGVWFCAGMWAATE